ncbi:MAG: VCBS repeat-containing protein [Pirellulaceae bacterium]|nr:VCBS repeat-containing protein [Pirellulaceae bacterium]
MDVLILVNKQNAEGSGPLTGQAVKRDPLVDVNGNNLFEPNDVLIVVNALNQTGPRPPRKVNIPLTTDSGVQQMPSVAIDPNDADNVVVAYMDYSLVDTGYAGLGVAVSRNGGTSWTRNQMPVPAGFEQGAANPIAKFDDQGRVYVSYMAATFLGEEKPGLTNPNFGEPRVPGFTSNNGVFIARSDDGGTTWNAPVAITQSEYDGGQEVPFDVIPEIAIDVHELLPDGHLNPHYGQLYATWSRNYPTGQFPGNPNSTGGIEVLFAISNDEGQTWEVQREERKGAQRSIILVDVTDPNDGNCCGPGGSFIDQPHLAVGAAGEVYVSHFGGANFALSVSVDGGETFSTADLEAPTQIVFGSAFESFGNVLPNSQFRNHTKRAVAADPIRPGHLFAAEAIEVRDELGTSLDAGDVFFGRSSDFARSWETDVMVGPYPDLALLPEGELVPLNDDNDARSADGSSAGEVVSGQAFPAITTDPLGNIVVVWYDQRRDPEERKLDVWGTTSTDGGLTFSPNFRITDTSFDPNAGVFENANGEQDFYLGDFIGLAVGSDRGLTAWADTRKGNQDVYLARFPVQNIPAPPNDRFEPNDTPDRNASPTMLGSVIRRLLPNLTVTPGDQDWFLGTSAASGQLIVSAVFDDETNVLPGALELELWDPTGTMILAQGQDILNENGMATSREFTAPISAGAEFLIRVLGSGNQTVDYGLRIQSLAEDLGTRVHATAAVHVGAGEGALFGVRTAATGSVEVVVSANSDGMGEFQVQILDGKSFALLTSGMPVGNGIVSVELTVRQYQDLLILVFAADEASGNLSLEFTNRDQISTSDAGQLFIPVAGGPSQATLGDVDLDGSTDVVVTSALSNKFSVLVGNGDGTLRAPREFSVGAFRALDSDINQVVRTFGRDVVVADVNHDRIPDLLVNNVASADISLAIGRGDGTTAPQRRFESTPAPFDLDVGDVDGDGNLDVVAVETAVGGTSVAISTLLGRGDGTFQVQRSSSLPIGGNNNGTIRLADLNEDGLLDVVASGDGAQPEVSVLLGSGDGTFTFLADYFAGRVAVALAVADINGDNHLDVVNVENDVFVLLGNGDATFQPANRVTGGDYASAVEIVDVGSLADGLPELGPRDGVPDLIVAYTGRGHSRPEVVVFPARRNDAGQYDGFESSVTLTSDVIQPRDVDVGDLNGDGIPDAVVTDRDGILVIYGEPPQFTPNDTPATARDLGTVVHLVDQTQTIVPDRQDAFYKFTVPTEEITAADEVIDVSLLFQYTEGDGIGAELLDAQGNILGSGQRFRVLAAQGEELTLHVFGIHGGSGAFTPVINVLPQVVSIEAQALLPGIGLNPGGPTTSIVVTLQGDRLDPETAQDPANFTVTSFGPDRLFGTADDRVIPIQEIVYSPGTNVSVSSGRTFPTAVRQTITLATDEPLPTGSYRVDLSANIRTEDFNDQEADLLADTAQLVGHPVVSLESGQIAEGSRRVATGLVLPATSVGDLGVFPSGTGFLTQLHADLAAQLDETLSDLGDDAQVTDKLLALLTERLVPTVGPSGQRITSLIAIWLDPVDLLFEIEDQQVVYEQATGTVTNTTDQCFVEVGGNIEVILCPLVDPSNELLTLDVSLVSEVSRGGSLQITTDEVIISSLTDPMRSGQTRFEFQY